MDGFEEIGLETVTAWLAGMMANLAVWLTIVRTSNLSLILAIEVLVSLYVLIGIGSLVYNLFISPLAKFPGPKIAAATGWYETFIDIWSNDFPERVRRMHQKYGPIVRVTPKEVHIDDAEYYDQVFVAGAKRRTNINHVSNPTTFALGLKASIVTAKTHEGHRQLRKHLESFFSRQGVTRIECSIQEEISLLRSQLQGFKGTGKSVRLNSAFAAFATDVICTVISGESSGLLQEPGLSASWYDSNRRLLDIIPIVRNFPCLTRLVRLIPASLLRIVAPSASGFRFLALFGASKVSQVNEQVSKGDASGTTGAKRSVFHHLLSSDASDSIKNVERLQDEAFILVGAGTITTSSTLAITTYHILANHQIETRLRKELSDGVDHISNHVPRWVELEKFPFLTACIREGLRLNRHFRRQVRISPDTDLVYKNFVIPKGTPVGMSNYILHMDPLVFPCPTKFVPERWLGHYDPRMDRNWVPFARGSRNCIGMNLSMAELYSVLYALFGPGSLKMTLASRDESCILPVQDSDVGVPKRTSHGLCVIVD